MPVIRMPLAQSVTKEQALEWVHDGLAMTAKAQNRAKPGGRDGLRGLRVGVGNGPSVYVPYLNTLNVRIPPVVGDDFSSARLTVLEDTIHEATHHLIRRSAGFPGLIAVGGPGRVGEGVAQAVAGATLALEGNAQERTYGQRILNPQGQTTPVGEVRKRDVPLSMDWTDLQDRRIRWYEDMGGVHVHGGIVTRAHDRMAQRIGLEPMSQVTFVALDSLTPVTGMQGWARATVEATENLYGPGAPEVRAVQDAWADVSMPDYVFAE